MMPTPDLTSVVTRLETENRNLLKRVNRLEKQRSSSVAALLANVILLVSAGLLADYLGLFPPAVDRLPLQARTVQAEEFGFRSRDGKLRGRLLLDDKGLRVVDQAGKSLPSNP